MEKECREMKVGEKISLIELLSELVKGGVEIVSEEEMKEVLMELEEEGNKHVEEEIEGEGEEEKREWEELSERACMLVRMMKKMKARREGKKTRTLRMVDKMEERNEELEEANGRLEEEIIALKAKLGSYVKEGERREIKGEEQKVDTYRVNKVFERKLLSEMRVLFGDWSTMRQENNSIIHNYELTYTSAFIGDKLDRSVHRMFESFVDLFMNPFLFLRGSFRMFQVECNSLDSCLYYSFYCSASGLILHTISIFLYLRYFSCRCIKRTSTEWLEILRCSLWYVDLHLLYF